MFIKKAGFMFIYLKKKCYVTMCYLSFPTSSLSTSLPLPDRMRTLKFCCGASLEEVGVDVKSSPQVSCYGHARNRWEHIFIIWIPFCDIAALNIYILLCCTHNAADLYLPCRLGVSNGPQVGLSKGPIRSTQWLCVNKREVINFTFSIKCSLIPDLSTGGHTVLIRVVCSMLGT